MARFSASLAQAEMLLRNALGRGGSHTLLQIRGGQCVAGRGPQGHAGVVETTRIPTRNLLAAPSGG